MKYKNKFKNLLIALRIVKQNLSEKSCEQITEQHTLN